MDAEGLRELILKRDAARAAVREIGERHLSVAVTVYAEMSEYVRDLEDIHKREEGMIREDIAVRIRFGQKVKKSGKAFWRLVERINSLHASGEMREQEGREFGKVLELIKSRRVPEAGRRLAELSRLVDVKARLDEAERLIFEARREIERERSSVERELSGAGAPAGDAESERALAQKYDRIMGFLVRYGSWREGYLRSLSAMPLCKLIDRFLSEPCWAELGFPEPGSRESLAGLRDILNAGLPEKCASEVAGIAGFSEKKLSHVMQDGQKFKRSFNANARWVDDAARLDKTGFLSLRIGLCTDALRDYAEKIVGEGLKEGLKEASLVSQGELLRLRHAKEAQDASVSANAPAGPERRAKLEARLEQLTQLQGMLPEN